MTTARSTQIDLHSTAFYHCITRCVRGSYLCGIDNETGQDFSYRKFWILDRIKELSYIFAVKICAYAIMSNHYHLVMFVDEEAALGWSSEEVKARWKKLFPYSAAKITELNLQDSQEKIENWRERLKNISWFMKCLNENIAKQANKEDDRRGHFWQARFKCQALLDDGALLSAMAYVDLNPIRAGLTQTPEGSDFTSIQERLNAISEQINQEKTEIKDANQLELQIDDTVQPHDLMPFANPHIDEKTPVIDFTLSDYIELVESTGRILREDKRGAIPENLPPILNRLNLNADGWLAMVNKLENMFSYAIGDLIILSDFGKQYRKHPPKGMRAARLCYINIAA